MEDAEKKKILKNSLEVCLTPEQKEILNLEFELSQTKEALEKSKEEVSQLEEQLFVDGAKYSFNSIKSKVRDKFFDEVRSSAQFKKRNNSFLDKINYAFFFVYSAYTFFDSLFLKNENKNRKY